MTTTALTGRDTAVHSALRSVRVMAGLYLLALAIGLVAASQIPMPSTEPSTYYADVAGSLVGGEGLVSHAPRIVVAGGRGRYPGRPARTRRAGLPGRAASAPRPDLDDSMAHPAVGDMPGDVRPSMEAASPAPILRRTRIVVTQPDGPPSERLVRVGRRARAFGTRPEMARADAGMAKSGASTMIRLASRSRERRVE